MTLAERVKKARKEQGLRQSDLSNKSNVSLMTVARIEMGAQVSRESRDKVRFALGLVALRDDIIPAKWGGAAPEISEEDKALEKDFVAFCHLLDAAAERVDKEVVLFNDEDLNGFYQVLKLARKYEVELPAAKPKVKLPEQI